jgi:exopolysaccharide production protein ExoY
MKRCFDSISALVLLLFFLPLMILIGMAVMLDGGPPLFSHIRVGANGKSFRCWKFRTMVVGAEFWLQSLLAASPDARAEWESLHKLKNDPRITPIGLLLRRSSLDELPQLFNVLKGDMSLVGPRPIVSDEIALYGDRFLEYKSCRPGMTGLWQIETRNDTTYARRVELDTLYVAHWSLRRDFLILLKTIFVFINFRGAY